MDAPFPTAMMPDIQKFFREVHPTLVPGRGVYDEVFATGLFFPLQRKRELARMLEIAGEPRTVVEIGADKGGGLYHWCMMPSVRNVIACEIRGTPYKQEFTSAFPDKRFLWLEESSYAPDVVRSVSEFTNCIDVLFIDGDKCGMLKDFAAYLPLMRKPGGVVFMHDVRDTGGPREAFATLAKAYRTEHIVDESEFRELEAARQYDVSYLPPLTPWQQWLLHWRGRSCTVGVVYL